MTRMKGLFKGIKKISQIFVYKEPEMEIGYPTDVKHVTHIGWDNTSSLDSPTWMNEFKTACDFSSKSLSNFVQSKECSWECQDYSQIKTQQHPSGFFTEPQLISEKPKSEKKVKKKKKLKDSSPTSFSVFSTNQC